MGLFDFGKKGKNPSEGSASVAKAAPNPPKIQTPPGSGPISSVRPPQPAGLIPASGRPAGAATTQPMVMPRSPGAALAPGMKPSRAGVSQSARSTQRIVLPSSGAGAQAVGTRPISVNAPSGRINLPIGMILRCLPPEVLAADISEFEASGAAATEIGLPMNMILSQLPSGKVEMTLEELVAQFPSGFLQPTQSIASYLPTLINLPLMDVVMRIPPDLLALRPDQKDVDSAIINMADPFTEEILREQAEAARRLTQTNIIDESQVPQTEEFVPQAQAAATKPAAPAPAARPPSPMPSPRSGLAQTAAMPAPPMPSRAGGIAPATGIVKARSPAPPTAPNATSRTISPSGRLPAPSRATTPIPTRPKAAVTTPIEVPPPDSLPAPPVPTSALQTSSLPMPPRAPVSSASLAASLASPTAMRASAVAPTPPVPVLPSSAPTPAPAPLPPPPGGADDLQRLAALAMAQMEEQEAEAGDPPAAEAEQPLPPEASETSPQQEEFIPAPALAAAPRPAAFKPAPLAFAPKPAPAPVAPAPAMPSARPAGPTGSALNLNNCTVADLRQIPECTGELAEAIIQYRAQNGGSFKRLEDLLEVPGMTKGIYQSLTGESTLPDSVTQSLNELLGFPPEMHVSLKDVTDRISCWPDVTGCILGQSTGLPLVGQVPTGMDKAAIVAFAPRMFDAVNKSFAEIVGRETDELIIPAAGSSFHILRNHDLYLVIISRLPQMPERHMKVARFVLAWLSIRQK